MRYPIPPRTTARLTKHRKREVENKTKRYPSGSGTLPWPISLIYSIVSLFVYLFVFPNSVVDTQERGGWGGGCGEGGGGIFDKEVAHSDWCQQEGIPAGDSEEGRKSLINSSSRFFSNWHAVTLQLGPGWPVSKGMLLFLAKNIRVKPLTTRVAFYFRRRWNDTKEYTVTCYTLSFPIPPSVIVFDVSGLQ